jgi:hypothetical protein
MYVKNKNDVINLEKCDFFYMARDTRGDDYGKFGLGTHVDTKAHREIKKMPKKTTL